MSAEDVLKEAAAALAARDLDAILSLYADDAVLEDASDGESYRGKAALRNLFEALFSAPATSFRIAAVRPGGDWGALEWVWSGRTGTSGLAFEVRGVSILEFAGARVARETISYDPAPSRR